VSRTSQSTTGRRRRTRHLLAFTGICVALIGIVLAASAGAKSAKLLGKTRHTPSPDCPRNCQGVGRVTGFPLEADGKRRPFDVRRNGNIVAFSLSLSRPTKNQRNFFGTIFEGGRFGKDPSVRLAVIRHKRRDNYKLIRQSPAVNLSGVLGRKQIFTLDKPLRVRKGQTVALTYPSWAPNFAHHGLSSRDDRWRASRVSGRCAPKSGETADVKRWAQRSRPQQGVGSVRSYGCDYRRGRLLYWAYFVPD
jgi:hypothetical protein